ncbi:Peptidylprolyl isomerase [Bertholletia excelsa]
MEMKGTSALGAKKAAVTPKAIIHQIFCDKACYKTEEVRESSTQIGCPGLAIPQKGPCQFRCCLELPDFSVVSEPFNRKKDAEHAAAKMALEKLGIDPTNDTSTVQDPWDALVGWLSYLFSNEFLLHHHPLSGHFRATLRREGQFNSSVPIPVLAAYDTKLSSICKSIDPSVESNHLLAISLVLEAASRLSGSVSTVEEQLLLKRENPYPPEIVESAVQQQLSSQGNISVAMIRIPHSLEDAVETLILNVSSNGYYMDAIANKLGLVDASKVLISRTIGRASSEMRLYFCAPSLCWKDSLLMLQQTTEAVSLEGSLNARASSLSGHVVYGDAILAAIGYTRKSSGLFYEDVSLRTYYRILVGKMPSGIYKVDRGAVLAAELPGVFTSRTNWKGSFPRDILCTFCRQHRLSEPVFSIINNPLELSHEAPGSCKKLKITESSTEEINGGVSAVDRANPEGSKGTFQCEVKMLSKCKDLIIQCCPKESFKKQNDAIQNSALKVLLWLDRYFWKLDMPVEELISIGNALDIQFYSQSLAKEFSLCKVVNSFWQRIRAEEDSLLDTNCKNQRDGLLGDTVCLLKIEGPDIGTSPSNGSLACIIYTISLVAEGDYMKEVIESNEEFEFEIGTGSVISCLESVVSQMSVGQSARFYMAVPPQEFILASARDSLRIISSLTSRSCSLEYCITLLRVTEPLEDRMEQALFSPPLSKQRVEYALMHIKQSCATSLVDFGCGSGSLLDSLLEYQTSLETVVGVDISQKGLIRAAKVLHSKLSRTAESSSPSAGIKHAFLYEGSITDVDSRVYGFDIGTCLEVIEHMEEDQACLFGDVVLSSFCPRILIVSTPNYEYNVILQRSAQSQEEDPDEKTQSPSQSPKFRNHDHKFEWTREQFNQWASNLATRHNYNVEFSGVGGAGDVEPGFASQIAVFRRRDGKDCPKKVDHVTHTYQIIWEWSDTHDSEPAL